MGGAFAESTVEDAALAWLEAIGREVEHGREIAPEISPAEPPIARTEPALRASSRTPPHVEARRPR